MEALLRELHEGPDGIPEYRDTEISGADLTIGGRKAELRVAAQAGTLPPQRVLVRGLVAHEEQHGRGIDDLHAANGWPRDARLSCTRVGSLLRRGSAAEERHSDETGKGRDFRRDVHAAPHS